MTLTDLLPKILLALVTTVFSDVYKRICRWLTNRGHRKNINQLIESLAFFKIFIENYREQREYDNQMIAKLFAVKYLFSKKKQ
jgi:hypothetical protein